MKYLGLNKVKMSAKISHINHGIIFIATNMVPTINSTSIKHKRTDGQD